MLQYLVLLPDSYNDENTLGSEVSDFNSVLLVHFIRLFISGRHQAISGHYTQDTSRGECLVSSGIFQQK